MSNDIYEKINDLIEKSIEKEIINEVINDFCVYIFEYTLANCIDNKPISYLTVINDAKEAIINRYNFSNEIIIEYDYIPDENCSASTADLSKELGFSDEKAKQIETRVEYLIGNKPKIVED